MSGSNMKKINRFAKQQKLVISGEVSLPQARAAIKKKRQYEKRYGCQQPVFKVSRRQWRLLHPRQMSSEEMFARINS